MISIVVPMHNEAGNIRPLHAALTKALKGKQYEILFVDDASTDSTFSELKRVKDRNTKIIKFKRNAGQSAALDAGFKHAKGDIVIAMDGDMQDDPAEIPRFLEKIKEGYDVVCGWRYPRKDSFFKKMTSRMADMLRRAITGEKIHDAGCTFKAFRKKALVGINLYGEMHRFLSAILYMKGLKITEIKVKHHHRVHGKTKYGVYKIVKGFVDLLFIKLSTYESAIRHTAKYADRPIHFFGGLGIVMAGIGFVIGLFLSYLKFMDYGAPMDRPLLILAVLLIIVGFQSFILGVLLEVLSRMYFKKGNEPYEIERVY